MSQSLLRLFVSTCLVASFGCGGDGAHAGATGGGGPGGAGPSSGSGGNGTGGGTHATGGTGGTAATGGGGTSSGGAAAVSFDAGVYGLLASEAAPDNMLLQNASVAGEAVRTAWATHEPSEGGYEWTTLDAHVAAAKAAHKKISVYIEVGAPDWLFDAGAKSLELTSPNGKTRTIPVPWDPIFLDKLGHFITAFGARYADEPTISYVRGASEAVTNGWGLSWTDSAGKPLSDHGYASPDTLLTPLKTVLDQMMAAFPHTAEWVEVGIVDQTEGFGIDDVAYFGQQLADYGFAAYPDRMGVWREDLSGCTKNPPTHGDWTIMAAHPGRNGAQMVWNVEDGPPDFRMDGCKMANPNTPATVLHNAVQKGLDFGMPYLEIYGTDCGQADLQPVLAFAAQSLH